MSPFHEVILSLAIHRSTASDTKGLADAEAIAVRGSMLVWQIEAALEHTRLYFTRASVRSAPPGDVAGEESHAEAKSSNMELLQQAQQKLDEVQKLIRRTEK